MAPQVGFEPTTSRLTVGCSTTELLRIRAHRRRAYSSDETARASAPKKRARPGAGLFKSVMGCLQERRRQAHMAADLVKSKLMPFLPVNDPKDSRVEAYRDVRERDLAGRQGLFVAEGEVVLRHLIGPRSRFEADSVLVAESRLEALAGLLEPLTVPVYAASQAVMDGIVGFPIHRGILAMGRRGLAPSLTDVVGAAGPSDVVLVAVGIGNHDNMGGLFRAAAAFGARAVVLDDTSCDPLYRKAIRVSVGGSLIQPFARLEPGQDPVSALAELGFTSWALTPSGPLVLRDAVPEGPTALIVGSEGPGLPESLLARCRRISIPMASGFDSLNVATAAAIALHHLAR